MKAEIKEEVTVKKVVVITFDYNEIFRNGKLKTELELGSLVETAILNHLQDVEKAESEIPF